MLKEMRDANSLHSSLAAIGSVRFVNNPAMEIHMIYLLKPASILGVLAILAIGASPAPAAKGVKKTQEHHIQGRVVSVQTVPGNVKGKKGPHAILTIHVTHHKHKKNQNANAVVAKGMTHTFNITMRSRIDVNQNVKGVGIAALRPGEHVTVFAHHHHADKVVIHHDANMKKKV